MASDDVAEQHQAGPGRGRRCRGSRQELILVHFSPQPEPFFVTISNRLTPQKRLRAAEKWTSVSPYVQQELAEIRAAPGRGALQNKHSTDGESTNRLRVSA